MGSRGRKSTADLAIADSTTVTEYQQPSASLTPEQRSEWNRVIGDCPADHFSESHIPMLEGYCRHTVALRHVGELIRQSEAGDEIDVIHYDRLLKMQERETRCLASLAVRLGFAKTTAPTKKKPPTGKLNDGNYDY